MNVPERVVRFARERFGAGAEVIPLPGDASSRRFYRLRPRGLAPLILMVHDTPFELETMPFFLHARFLGEIGAAVPQILASYPGDGIIVVRDLGDETLQTHLDSCDGDRRRFLYLQAVRMIALLQQEGTPALTPDLPAANTALDSDRLLFELRFFSEHYIEGLLGSPLGSDQAERLDAWFVSLANQVAGYPRVLCHRDFHSRNLMVKGDRLFMVDFQDARMGPYTYDLASLIRDAYVRLPEDLVEELTQFFREVSHAPEPRRSFETALTRTCLQRGIKAIGTFASQVMLRGNRDYIRYIDPAMRSIRATLSNETVDREAPAILELFAGPLASHHGRVIRPDGPD